jgi:SUMO ligase MMS21 Smc5/6 complex component
MEPPELCCPITRTLFTDPVFASDGQTYERSAINKYVNAYNTRNASALACCK